MFNRKVGIIFSLLLVLVATGVSFSGYAPRITTWSSGQTLNASNLNAEFDNVLDNGVGVTTTQTLTNKTLTSPTLTSPVINTSVSGTAFLDEDDMTSDSATKLASQQSIKAYTDAHGLIQRVRVDDGEVSTGSGFNVMGYDDSIPQSNEGFRVLSTIITPTSATSIIRVSGQVVGTYDSGVGTSQVIVALFKDAVSSAIAVSTVTATEDEMATVPFNAEIVAGGTSPIEFKVRFGLSGGGIDMTFNGINGGRLFGGVSNSFINIEEIQP
jgi:hypothetical protein